VSSADVVVLEEIDLAIQKVKVGCEIFCLKSVHQKLDVASFQREIQTLKGCSHPNIVRLFHLVTDKHDMVEAMLLEYISDAQPLSKAESLVSDQYTRWTEQIRDAIQYLHRNNLVWGDAKPGNILIRGTDSIVLVDFGGGYTEGWVDSMSSGTKQGDWEGYQKIVRYLLKKVVDVKSGIETTCQ
jgi:serine/threonine protein kinase